MEVFEDDRNYSRKGGGLVAVLVVLLVAGTLLAVICLPAWDAEHSGMEGTLARVKTHVMTFVGMSPKMPFPLEGEPGIALAAAQVSGKVEVLMVGRGGETVATIVLSEADYDRLIAHSSSEGTISAVISFPAETD